MSKSFKTPDKMNFEKEVRVPISIRIFEEKKEILIKASEKRKVKLAILVEGILNDYATYLIEQKYVSTTKKQR